MKKNKTGLPRHASECRNFELPLRTVVTDAALLCKLAEVSPDWTEFENFEAIWLACLFKHSCCPGNRPQLEQAESKKADYTTLPPAASERAATSFWLPHRMTNSHSFLKPSSVASTMSFLNTMLNSMSNLQYNALQSLYVVTHTSYKHTDASLNRNGNSVNASLMESSLSFLWRALDVACGQALNAAFSTVHFSLSRSHSA